MSAEEGKGGCEWRNGWWCESEMTVLLSRSVRMRLGLKRVLYAIARLSLLLGGSVTRHYTSEFELQTEHALFL